MAEKLPPGVIPLDEELPPGVAELQAAPQPRDSLISEILRPFATTGREFTGGLRQAFAPQYSTPEPSAFERYASTPASQVMGLIRALASPITGFLTEPAQRGVSGLARTAGAPEDISQMLGETAGLGAAFATPSQFFTGPIQAGKSLLRGILRPAIRPLQTADELAAANKLANIKSEENWISRLSGQTAFQQQREQAAQGAATAQELANWQTNTATNMAYETNLAMRRAATEQAEQAGARVARAAPEIDPFARVSPLAKEVAAPLTTREAYAFLKEAGMAEKKLPTPELSKTLSEAAIEAAKGGPQSVTAQMAKEMFEKAGYVPGTGNRLDVIERLVHNVGQMRKNPDGKVSGFAGKLYRNLMDDLRASATTDANAKRLYDATRVARWNFSAEELADIATNWGTRTDRFGQIHIQSIRNKLANDDYLREGFPPDALRKIADTLDEVFQVYKDVPAAVGKGALLPEIVPVGASQLAKKTMVKFPKKRPEEVIPKYIPNIVSRHPAALFHMMAGTGLGTAVGLPAAATYGAVVGSAIFYPRMIFRVALKPGGQEFLRALYAGKPPVVNDLPRMTAVANFLRQFGEEVPEDPGIALQQQQQQAAQQAQQQQQAQMLQMMMQTQQGGKSR